jgi:hypothetical protein
MSHEGWNIEVASWGPACINKTREKELSLERFEKMRQQAREYLKQLQEKQNGKDTA